MNGEDTTAKKKERKKRTNIWRSLKTRLEITEKSHLNQARIYNLPERKK